MYKALRVNLLNGFSTSKGGKSYLEIFWEQKIGWTKNYIRVIFFWFGTQRLLIMKNIKNWKKLVCLAASNSLEFNIEALHEEYFKTIKGIQKGFTTLFIIFFCFIQKSKSKNKTYPILSKQRRMKQLISIRCESLSIIFFRKFKNDWNLDRYR